MPALDPAQAYTLQHLLAIKPPPEPKDFADFWQKRYQQIQTLDFCPSITPSQQQHPDFDCFDLSYLSSGQVQIKGWVLIPKRGSVTRGIVVGHGYGGRDQPDFDLPVANAAFVFPCFRGLSLSRCAEIPEQPNLHVLHRIKQRDHYVLGGCVEDLWLAVSVLLNLFPATQGHVGYMGLSFGGGIGALALAWDQRIQRAHFNVPSFGHQPLRLQLPTIGSAAALQAFKGQFSNIYDTLSYYDAAVAARHIQAPTHIAAALIDPVVTPPGQFSIYNALSHKKQLFVLDMGHSQYARQAAQNNALKLELETFFSAL